MKKLIILTLALFGITIGSVNTQSNIYTTKEITTQFLTGDYTFDPEITLTEASPRDYALNLTEHLNQDSLRSYVETLASFGTRNTGSDTLSETRGIGAARDWIYDKFEQFNTRNGGHSITDFLEFDRGVCGMSHHKNVLMVHPGYSPEEGVIIIEAHFDSRCDTPCDIDCDAPGAEDNGSGSALVIELARVMTQMFYKKTLVFMATTGEEQGLFGAEAMAEFCEDNQVNVKAVLNNDIVGGVICGETSSPPSCDIPGSIDSTMVRIFSFGIGNSPHKALARYIKLQYQEELMPLEEVPMEITLMTQEDRGGRGGDHIPFRQRDIPAIRFTAANENGDAGIDEEYMDHQHTSDDILGVDTDGDGMLDSLFVDFNYLSRNSKINGMAAAMLSINLPAPAIEVERIGDDIEVTVITDQDVNQVRIGLRETGNEFQELVTIDSSFIHRFSGLESNRFYFFSACVVDENGLESCFSEELILLYTDVTDANAIDNVSFYSFPNPFKNQSTIAWELPNAFQAQDTEIVISNNKGQIIEKIQVEEPKGNYNFMPAYTNKETSILYYSLVTNGKVLKTKKMVKVE